MPCSISRLAASSGLWPLLLGGPLLAFVAPGGQGRVHFRRQTALLPTLLDQFFQPLLGPVTHLTAQFLAAPAQAAGHVLHAGVGQRPPGELRRQRPHAPRQVPAHVALRARFVVPPLS